MPTCNLNNCYLQAQSVLRALGENLDHPETTANKENQARQDPPDLVVKLVPWDRWDQQDLQVRVVKMVNPGRVENLVHKDRLDPEANLV